LQARLQDNQRPGLPTISRAKALSEVYVSLGRSKPEPDPTKPSARFGRNYLPSSLAK